MCVFIFVHGEGGLKGRKSYIKPKFHIDNRCEIISLVAERRNGLGCCEADVGVWFGFGWSTLAGHPSVGC